MIWMITINTAFILATIAMAVNKGNQQSGSAFSLSSESANKRTTNNLLLTNGTTDASSIANALLNVCWFICVEMVHNIVQPFILYATLLKDTKYWRNFATLITMSSALDVPERGGTLDLLIENYRDIELLCEMTHVPVLDFAHFELKKPIGRGSTASVHRAYYRGFPVACKNLASTSSMFHEISYDVVHHFCREAMLFMGIQHMNIIKFYGVCVRPPALYLVFELATNGTLRDLLDSSARKRQRGRCMCI